MASQTLTGVEDRFPVGTTVSVYLRPGPGVWDGSGTPPGFVVSTAAVAGDGSLSFTGLDAGAFYVGYAAGRSLDFRADPVPPAAGTGTVAVLGEKKFIVPGRDGVSETPYTGNQRAALQGVLDTVSHGHIVLTKGLYNFQGELYVPQYSDPRDRLTVEFDEGAILKRSDDVAGAPVLNWIRDDGLVKRPQVEGPSSKCGLVGIKLGPSTGDHTRGVPYRVVVENGIYSNLGTGIEVGIVKDALNPANGNSAGDVEIRGGYFKNMVDAVLNRGFTTRAYSLTAFNVSRGWRSTGERQVVRSEVWGMTVSTWSDVAVWVEGGDGADFYNVWAERPNGSAAAPAFARLGSSVAAGDAQNAQARHVRFSGATKAQGSKTNPAGSVFVIRNAHGLEVDYLSLSTDGGPPDFIVDCEATHAGTGNRIRKVALWPGHNGKNQFMDDPASSPGYPVPIRNRGTGDFFIDELPAAEGTPRGSTVRQSTFGQFRFVSTDASGVAQANQMPAGVASLGSTIVGATSSVTVADGTELDVFCAMAPCKIMAATVIPESLVAESDANYWTVTLVRTRAGVETTIASKTTKTLVSSGQAMTARQGWNFDGINWQNNTLSKGDVVTARFTATGTPATSPGKVRVQVRYEA